MKCGFLHSVFILKDILFQKKKKMWKDENAKSWK